MGCGHSETADRATGKRQPLRESNPIPFPLTALPPPPSGDPDKGFGEHHAHHLVEHQQCVLSMSSGDTVRAQGAHITHTMGDQCQWEDTHMCTE